MDKKQSETDKIIKSPHFSYIRLFTRLTEISDL